jgi:iron(III) transport system ATP-binding protein
MEIRIDNVSRHYGTVKALDNVSLTVRDGEIFFLLGPSGCGKTTLLRCLGGFEQPTAGKIYFDGQDVAGLPPNERNSAMVFQGYALWPNMTVAENVSFGLEMQGVPNDERKRRVQEALQQVQIAELAGRRINELSGGQQQRVALARTLIVHPGCLLLDEPLANLDAKLRRDMRHEIRQLCKDNGLTAIYVTHDRQEALSMGDRLAVLRQGRICQLGTPEEVYRHPASEFVASFLGETSLLPAHLLSWEDGEAKLETAEGIFLARAQDCPVPVDGDCLLSLRPEVFRPATGGEICNTLELTLKHIDYQGEIADHVGQTPSGVTVKYYELNPRTVPAPGTKIRLAVAPEDVVILPAEA